MKLLKLKEELCGNGQIATNSWFKTVSIYLDEAPWWVFVLEKFTFKLCSLMPHFKLPFSDYIKIKDGGEVYTLYEWYGGIDGLFHYYICKPIIDYCRDRTEMKRVDITWDRLKELDEELWNKGEQEHIEYLKE